MSFNYNKEILTDQNGSFINRSDLLKLELSLNN